MTILEQAKREYAALSLEMEKNPTFKKIRALEAILAAYGDSTAPGNGSLRIAGVISGNVAGSSRSGGGVKGAALKAADDFIRQNNNSADYNNIFDYVNSVVPAISKKRLSIYMSASKVFKFNKDTKQWQL
jgi:hypothetical protein